MTGRDAEGGTVPTSLEEAEFLVNIDYYVEAAEKGQEFRLTRNGVAICHLGPAER